MYFVYVLRSQSSRKLYTGHCADLVQRLGQHNSGVSRWTRNRGPWRLIYHEKFAPRAAASPREKYVQTGRRRKPLAGNRSPNVVAAQGLPEALQPPDHVQLPVGKMLQKAVTHEPHNILPVVVPFVGDFLLQDRTDGNHRRKCIPENQELHEEYPAQHAKAGRENDGADPSDLDYPRSPLKRPQLRKRKRTDPAVTPAE